MKKWVIDGLHRRLDQIMARHTIGMETEATITSLVEALNRAPDAVVQQKAIELLIARHAARMGNRKDALTVVEGVAKHARQLVNQVFDEGWE